MINRLCKSPSCRFIIYNRNVVSIDRGGTEDTILNDKYSTVAPSGRITKLTSVHLHQNKTNMKICLVLNILRNGCFVKVVLQRKCVLKCSENVLVLNTQGAAKKYCTDCLRISSAVWEQSGLYLTPFVVQYERTYLRRL